MWSTAIAESGCGLRKRDQPPIPNEGAVLKKCDEQPSPDEGADA